MTAQTIHRNPRPNDPRVMPIQWDHEHLNFLRLRRERAKQKEQSRAE